MKWILYYVTQHLNTFNLLGTRKLVRSDFTGSSTVPAEGEIRVQSGYVVVSNEDFQRPITVEAEMKTDGYTECITMTLFAKNGGINSEISLGIGHWNTKWRFFPGDNRGVMGSIEDWRKVKLELDETNNVKYYVDGELKYSTQSSKNTGKLRFVAGCQSMKIRNIQIGMKIIS